MYSPRKRQRIALPTCTRRMANCCSYLPSTLQSSTCCCASPTLRLHPGCFIQTTVRRSHPTQCRQNDSNITCCLQLITENQPDHSSRLPPSKAVHLFPAAHQRQYTFPSRSSKALHLFQADHQKQYTSSLPMRQPPKGGRGCLMSPPCLESQGCHLIPLCCRLSCSSA